MSQSSVAIRLSAEGGDAVVRALQDIGRAAQQEFQRAATSARAAVPAVRDYDNAQEKLDRRLGDSSGRQRFSKGLDEMSSGFYQVGAAIPVASQAVMTLTDSLGALAYGAGAMGVFAGGVELAARALLALGTAGNLALEDLAKLDEATQKIGTSANALRGLEIVGTRSGATPEESRSGMINAGGEFEQYRRNAGEVKDAIEKIDESFLKVLDKTRTFDQFWNAVLSKVQALPREEGMDLAKALLGDETGEKLYAAIARGETAMQALNSAAVEAGATVDEGLVRQAGELQKKVDEAALIAKDKLLNAFNDLAPVVAQIKTDFWEAAGGLASWMKPLKEAYGMIQSINGLMDSSLKAIEDGAAPARLAAREYVARNELRARLQSPEANLGGREEFKDLPVTEDIRARLKNLEYRSDGNVPAPPARPRDLNNFSDIGTSRARYAARDEESSGGGSGRGGASAREERDAGAEMIATLERQLQLTTAVGDARREIATQIQIERNLKAAKVEDDSAESNRIRELTRQIETATEATRQRKAAQDDLNHSSQAMGQMMTAGIEDALLSGKSLDKIFDDILKKMIRMSIESAVMGSGPMAGVFGTKGKDGAGGGLLGMAMGGLSGGGGGSGGLFASLFGSVEKFANGGDLSAGRIGIGGEAGLELLMRPTAVTGPASFLPLSKLQKGNNPASMNVVINDHAGVDVTPRLTPEGVDIMINQRVSQALNTYDRTLQSNLYEKQAREF